MEAKLDKKDIRILEILRERGDLSVRQIASRTVLPITTVHNRIKRMKSLGVIKRFTIEVDKKKIGKALAAYVLVKIDSRYLKGFRRNQHDLVKGLRKFGFVEKADVVTGTIDIVLLIRVRDVDELDKVIVEKLRDTQGIEDTQTLVILREN
ncbi:MAG: winged helix-turn-helix transcriptional regulator [Candidatus Aenigmarchaeota archaeon]|nr:winged helix-turn-helix transcriptional regulator [Candidatus Aenigmarchaeota archaeon]